MTRTIEVIAKYIDTATSVGATKIQIVGTAACRRARNAAAFSELLQAKTQLTLEVLSESDEAALTFSGALIGLPVIDTPTLVIDIGGGSTEYTVGTQSIDVFASIPFGAVTSTDSHISSDLPRPEDLTNLIGAVSDELEDITRDHPIVASPIRTVGVAGTIVTIAAVELGLHEFDDTALHGMALSREAVEDVFRTEEHLRRRTTDTWHLYPTAGTEVSQFHISQALTGDPHLPCNQMTFIVVLSVKKPVAIQSRPLITSAALTPTLTQFNERAYWRKMLERHPS